MFLKGHFQDGSNWHVSYRPTEQDLLDYYGYVADEEEYENDKDFTEYLEDTYKTEISEVLNFGYEDLNDYLENKEDYE